MILKDWVSFFNDAGVQSSAARTYADAFVQGGNSIALNSIKQSLRVIFWAIFGLWSDVF